MNEELTPKEAAFKEALKQTGYKLGAAYRLISPACTPGTCRNEGSKLMRKLKEKGAFNDPPQTALSTSPGVPQVAAAQLPVVSQPITRESIVSNCERVAAKAENNKHYTATLKAYELQSKLLNLYDDSKGDLDLYLSFIKKISIGSVDQQSGTVIEERKVKAIISHSDKSLRNEND